MSFLNTQYGGHLYKNLKFLIYIMQKLNSFMYYMQFQAFSLVSFPFSGMILQILTEITKHVITWTRAQNQVFIWAKLWFTDGNIQKWSLMSQMFFTMIPIPLAIWLTNTSNLNYYPVMLIWEVETTLVRIQLVFI